jgi:hypothetical protein
MIDCGAGTHTLNRCGVDEDTVKKIMALITLAIMIAVGVAISAIENS